MAAIMPAPSVYPGPVPRYSPPRRRLPAPPEVPLCVPVQGIALSQTAGSAAQGMMVG